MVILASKMKQKEQQSRIERDPTNGKLTTVIDYSVFIIQFNKKINTTDKIDIHFVSVFFFASYFGQIPTGQAFRFSRTLCYGLPLPILFAPPHKKPSFVPVVRSSRRAI